MMSRHRLTFSSTSDIISRLDECRGHASPDAYTCRALADLSRQFDLGRPGRTVVGGGALSGQRAVELKLSVGAHVSSSVKDV